MPDSGKDLGADLDWLETMAQKNLPDVAAEYAMAAAQVDATSSTVGAVFVRSPEFGGVQGPAFGPWTDLKDTIHTFLSDTADNLLATAHALRAAVDTIAETDAAAAAELNRLRAQHGTAGSSGG